MKLLSEQFLFQNDDNFNAFFDNTCNKYNVLHISATTFHTKSTKLIRIVAITNYIFKGSYIKTFNVKFD